ncbi:hypothetical protein AO735_18205 [Pseudomonas sp. TTU2014-096BSC]|nr:hypothetical protein AO735_18205 [Pseudomonas sp. TTU2014-096BSC]
MRGYKAITSYYAMMTNMITTPQYNIITQYDERLNCIIFKNKTVLTNFHIMPNKSPRTHIACGFITSFLSGLVKSFAKTIEPSVGCRRKKAVVCRIEMKLELLKSYNGQAE